MIPLVWPTTTMAPRKKLLRGVARIVFVGRVVPMKNLGFALAILAEVKGEVEFNIFGPLEDRVYWERCRGMLADLPPSVSVRYGGELHPDAVPAILAEHHLLFLPTLGENFGHVISESLAAGCPVLISDRTPWRHLEQAGGGWDLPLEDAEAFRQALQSCIDLDEDHHQQLRAAARALVMPSGPAGLGPDAYRRMLNGVLRGDVPRLEAGR